MRQGKAREEKATEHVRAVRERERLTQEQFAEKLGVSKNTISRIERGETALSADMALKVHDAFFISIDYLFGLTPYEDGEPLCSASCEELINAQNDIDRLTLENQTLRRKMDTIKAVLEEKEKPLKLNVNKAVCSD